MIADDLTKTLRSERQRKLARMMKMRVWQKSEDYIITKVDEKKKEEGEESNFAKV